MLWRQQGNTLLTMHLDRIILTLWTGTPSFHTVVHLAERFCHAEVGPLENPGPMPMGVVDAADFPSRLEQKDDLAPPPDPHNFVIGAGIPPEIAAQYGEGLP